ncbi:MAG: hypothetical protein KR126chlam6_00564 [Candidatus Anoxychlamydiales bacterium]|nr:hypothetical protein [Candidatus Anoxychlamydiales bacterium]
MNKYIYTKSNEKFKKYFIKQKAYLQKRIGEKVKIKHIGSTAVEGLGGKNILDISIGVEDKWDIYKKKLEKDGFKFLKKASTKGRLFFKKDIEEYKIHIHLTKSDSKIFQELIFFCEYLKKHPKTVKEYIKIKKEAIKQADGIGGKYRAHKNEFIKNIIKKCN